ncbi:MAG: gamma carbonic anhydrase family protein [Acidobacteria bacterium]|nr:gamma carbonic anhydrase family protein [Acidobacteriota bacterium]
MLRPFRGRQPAVPASAYVDPSAQVIGDVTLGERVSVWPNVTIRADICSVEVGDESNIQDNSVLHVDGDKPVRIGERVVVGHSCTVHGCTIEDDCLIGMGSTILNGARVGAGSIVAAGSLVLERQEIPPRSIVMGSPAKVRRATSDEELERTRRNAARYVELSREYMRES